MIIKYTETKAGKVRINSIEDVISWGEISEKYDIGTKSTYLCEYPFYNLIENKLEIWKLQRRKVGSRMVAPHVVSVILEIGEEYSRDKFEECKELIKQSELRVKNIINYVEEEEVWDSTNNN